MRIKTTLETIIIVVSIAYAIGYLGLSESADNILLDLGVFIFGASRAIPAINQVVLGLNKIRYCSNSINILFEELKDDKLSNSSEISFDTNDANALLLDNVSASYTTTDTVILEDINFKMGIGNLIGIYRGIRNWQIYINKLIVWVN